MNEIDPISIISVPIEVMSHNEILLSTATGFFWRKSNGQTFLVSNYHVFSGNHYLTNQCFRQNSAFPAKIRYPRIVSQNHLHERSLHTILLCDEAGNDQIWKSHPLHNDYPIDLAIVEISTIADDGSSVCAVNDEPQRQCNRPLLRYNPGFELIIAGFFMRDRPTGYFPIYIKAFVASEMDALYEGKRAFLVDAQTSSGMSGSPVFATGFEVVDPTQKFGGGFKTVPPFVGIYSGRVIEKEDGVERELQVGVVWRRELIHETVEFS